VSYRDGSNKRNKPILSLDFDGVIHGYGRGWTGPAPEDPPVPGAREAIAKLREDWYVVVFSTRAYTEDGLGLEHIGNYLDHHEIYVDDIVKEKPRATVSVDDRAFRFEGDWSKVHAFLDDEEAQRPWNKKRSKKPATLLKDIEGHLGPDPVADAVLERALDRVEPHRKSRSCGTANSGGDE